MNSCVRQWVDEIKTLTTPSAVVYCDGSQAERERLIAECVASGELVDVTAVSRGKGAAWKSV